MCQTIVTAVRGKNKPIYKRSDPTKGDKVLIVYDMFYLSYCINNFIYLNYFYIL